MIELLRIHAVVRTARILVLVARAADFVTKAAIRKAGVLADETTAWADARDARGCGRSDESAIQKSP